MGKPWWKDGEALVGIAVSILYGCLVVWLIIALLQDFARMQ